MPSKLIRKGIGLALALCVFSPQLPALADDDEVDEAALIKAESVLFGGQSQSGSIEDRLERAEVRVFGKRKGGSDEERIERLTSTLLIEHKKTTANKSDDDKDSDKKEKSDRAEKSRKAEKSDKSEMSAKSDDSKNAEDSKTAEDLKKAEELRKAEEQKQAEEQRLAEEQRRSEIEAQTEAKRQAEARESEEQKKAAEALKNEEAKKAEEAKAAELAKKPVSNVSKVAKGSRGSKGRNTASKAGNKPLSGSPKNGEVKLTSETATMDVRNAEKPRPQVSDYTPAAQSGSPSTANNSNRIARGAQPKVSQATALLRQGMELHRRGDDVRAEQIFKKVVLLEPRNPDGYYNLGAIAEKKHDLAAALMSYRAALNLSPDDRELHEAVDAVEGMLGMANGAPRAARGKTASASGSSAGSRGKNNSGRAGDSRSTAYSQSQNRNSDEHSAEIREFYSRGGAPKDSFASGGSAAESSDRFADGSYGFGRTAQGGPRPAPNFYRAKAKSTRELQDEAAPYADVTDPDAPELTVTNGPVPAAVVEPPSLMQLNATQNSAIAPVMNVSQGRRGHPVASAATRAIVGTALSVGTSYALRSSGLHGLHCPICRVTSGGALRGLLRF